MQSNNGKKAKDKRQALNWALVLAANDGYTDIVSALLEAGADVRAGNDHALEVAALHGHTETARVLLEAGADPREESSPLAAWRLAARNGHKDTVKALFEWTEHHLPVGENGKVPRP